MNGSFTQKFRILSDPPVVKTPFKIDLDEEKCIGCGLCVQQCPCQTLALVERSYAENQEAACQFNCPSGVDIRKYLKVLAEGGTFRDAWEIITDANPFPATTGLVCPHPCEGGCNRQYADNAVNINEVERFIGKWAIEEGLAFRVPETKSGKKIAVIGSGPSGISCAYHLTKLGHEVTVYEADKVPGGMLTYAIPSYRLPESVVQGEIKRVLDMGVTLILNTQIGREITLDELKEKFDAVYIATGAQKSASLGPEWEGHDNIFTGLEFLRAVSEKRELKIGKRVIVIGGGNVALDVARSALRLGASSVELIALESRDEMVAYDDEIEAGIKEGVLIRNGWGPNRLKVSGSDVEIELKQCTGVCDDYGNFSPVYDDRNLLTVKADSVIIAIGQRVDTDFQKNAGIAVERGLFKINRTTFETSINGIFAGGDAVTGPLTVTEAIGAGQRAALSINAVLYGKTYSAPEKKEISFRDVPLYGYKKVKRNDSVKPAAGECLKGISNPVNGDLNSGQVRDESSRCMECGKYRSDFTGSRSKYFGKVCLSCRNCEAICPHDALGFQNYYRVEKGRWSNTSLTIPDKGKGYPNPFMEEKPPQFKDIENKITGIERVIYRRRSNRVFRDKEVPREMIHRILEAGRFAPSAGNAQPWKFVVVRDPNLLDELSNGCTRTLGMITRIYQGKGPLRTMVKNAAAFLRPDGIDQRPMVAIQALLTPQFGDKQMDVFFGATTVIYVLVHHMGISTPVFSTGICCQNMVLTAHSLGLGTCYAGFGAEPVNMSRKLRKKLGIKWPYDHVATAIVVGYPAVEMDKPVEREFPQVDWIE